jgi:hypothetical protein
MTNWRAALTVMVGLFPLVFALAAITLWRAWRVSLLAALVSAVGALLVVVVEAASIVLWLRVRELVTALANYNLSQYPSVCMGPDDVGHFSPPYGYFSGMLRVLAQVAPLEHAATVNAVVAVAALALVGASALLWGRKRAPAPQTA